MACGEGIEGAATRQDVAADGNRPDKIGPPAVALASAVRTARAQGGAGAATHVAEHRS